MQTALWVLAASAMAVLIGIFLLAIYRVATGTDKASKGPDDEVNMGETVVAVIHRGGKRKLFQREKETIK